MSGAITAAVVVAGGAAYAANKSSKAAKQASTMQAISDKNAQDLGQQQLDFQIQQYDDWKSIFGDVQDNLSKYYNTMTPETQAAVNLQGIQEEYQKSRQNLQRQLAQRGITDSGVMAEGLTQVDIARAQQAATARAMAPQQVAQQQASFLGLGLGQQGSLQAGISGAYGQQMQLLSNQAGTYGQQAAMAGQAQGQAIGAIGNVAGQLVGSGAFSNLFNTSPASTTTVPSTYQPTQYQSVFGTNNNWYSGLS